MRHGGMGGSTHGAVLPDWFEEHMRLAGMLMRGEAFSVPVPAPYSILLARYGDGTFRIGGRRVRLIGWFNGPVVQEAA